MALQTAGETNPSVLNTGLKELRALRLVEHGDGGYRLTAHGAELSEILHTLSRTTARCGAEYEWGVHIRGFAGAANLTNAQIGSLVHGDSEDDCWNDEEAVLLRTADALDARATLDDDEWSELTGSFSDEAILEILLLAGFYRTTSYLVNSLACHSNPVPRDSRTTPDSVASRATIQLRRSGVPVRPTSVGGADGRHRDP